MPNSNNFTEKDMAKAVQARAKADGIDISQENTGKILDMWEAETTEQLKAGKKVKMQNFGTFEVRVAQARERYNPATKQKQQYPETKIPKWDASDAVREAIAKS